MSLSGKLGFVPIAEVLRLLTRSHQQGSVDVTGNGLRGRVFFGGSGIDLATTSDNDDLHRHLLNSGYADQKILDRITSGETTLAAVAEANLALIELIREMTVESLYQVADRGREFRVREGATTPYASPTSFDLEALLEDAEERKKEWDKVSEVIPDLSGAMNFCRDIGEREEVTISVDDWKVLSEIGSGSSVTEIADHLGTTEFWTARVAARLVKNDLILLGSKSVPAQAQSDPEYTRSVAEETDADGYEADDVSYEAEEVGETPVLEQPVARYDEAVDQDESWWQEPEGADDSTVKDPASKTPEVVSEGLSEIPGVEAANDAAFEDSHEAPDEAVRDNSDGDSDVEEDTEAFLEKVFSELETSEPEAEEGHGLLRRRRMGTLRDFSSDS